MSPNPFSVTKAAYALVEATFKNPSFNNAGYDVLASFSDVDPGEYEVRVLQVSSAGRALTCNTRRKLKVE